MIETATGLILRTRPLTDTSLIVHWLTPDLGRLATVAKGARRPKSAFAGKLDLFYLADFSFQRSRHSELHTLREAGLRETHAVLREELGWLQQASYAVALLEQTTETDTPLPEIFALMLGFLQHLPARPPVPRTMFAFEVKLLNELGLQPSPDRLAPDMQQLFRIFQSADWPALGRLKLSTAQEGHLRNFLQAFLLEHLGKVPRGRAAAVTGEV